jgi:hypothetical protein
MVNAGCPQHIKKQAECEMAAFLKATADLVGHRGLLRAGDAWIRAMESIEWPSQNYEKFFRRVTILAISRLLANSDAEAYERKCGLNHQTNFDNQTLIILSKPRWDLDTHLKGLR